MIEGVLIKELKLIRDERGFLMEMMRSDDAHFEKFGQVYLSVCNPGFAKAWHYHKKQSDNMAVVKGNAKLVLYDMRDDSSTKGEVQEILMGENNPVLVKIPPMVAHGITPDGDDRVYMVNTPTELYNYEKPDEFRIPFNSKQIPYDWGVERGG